MDLLIGADGDLVFENGGCPITKDRAEVVAQRLRIRLRTFYGEWFLTYDYGTPWLERVLGRRVKKSMADIVIQEQIYLERGVAEITFFESSFNAVTRSYYCRFRVKATSGEETEDIIIQ